MATIPMIARMIAHFRAYEYPKQPAADLNEALMLGWAEDLAELTDDELAAACKAYRTSTDPADRWWPQPGRLIALSPVGRAALALGSETDADAAWADFNRRMQHLAGRGGPLRGERELDSDGYRNDAMWAGLRGIGGARVWDRWDLSDRAIPARWRAAYVAARVASRQDRDAVRVAALALTATPPKAMLTERQ
jgi:hypothetical protein